MKPTIRRKTYWLTLTGIILLSLVILRPGIFRSLSNHTRPRRSEFNRPKIAKALEGSINQLQFLNEIPFEIAPGHFSTVHPVYAIDWELQSKMEKLIRQYRPDYAAFVALEADTGRVLSLISYTSPSAQDQAQRGHLALLSHYPAASLFKIVTAAAAIDSQKARSDTRFAFNGGYHTLYRRNVTAIVKDRWTREMTMKEAFSKSVNTVFAKIGMFLLAPDELAEYARRFRFNQEIASDLPVQSGQFALPSEDKWSLAEAASGFNRWITMSPLHGAMMGGALANDGIILDPYLIDSLTSADGSTLYQATPNTTSLAISKEAAEEVRSLMRETVLSGTSRKSFRTLVHRRKFPEVEIGGKTGSLTGTNPKGKYDWFVGYARSEEPKKRIGIAALTINEKTWKVKSSFLARSFVELYYRKAKESKP